MRFAQRFPWREQTGNLLFLGALLLVPTGLLKAENWDSMERRAGASASAAGEPGGLYLTCPGNACCNWFRQWPLEPETYQAEHCDWAFARSCGRLHTSIQKDASSTLAGLHARCLQSNHLAAGVAPLQSQRYTHPVWPLGLEASESVVLLRRLLI